MGQFGNLISCAKEEMCLNTDCSPELTFPNTLISPMADFLHQKEFSSGWKWTLKIPLEVELCWRGLHFMGELLQELQLLPDTWFCPIAGHPVNLKIYYWVILSTLCCLDENNLFNAWEQASRDPAGKVKLKLVLFSPLNFSAVRLCFCHMSLPLRDLF